MSQNRFSNKVAIDIDFIQSKARVLDLGEVKITTRILVYHICFDSRT